MKKHSSTTNIKANQQHSRFVPIDLPAFFNRKLNNNCLENSNEYQVNIVSEKLAIKKVIHDLNKMLDSTGLLGTYPNSPLSSITVSSTVAVGLQMIGEYNLALRLVQNVNRNITKLGLNRVVYSPPLPDGGHRPYHNLGNFWGLYSNLLINPCFDEQPLIMDSARTFISIQHDGGWGFTENHKNKPYFTAHILLALIKLFELTPNKPELRPDGLETSIHKGINYLCHCGDLEKLVWAEQGPVNNETLNLPTTVITLHALSEYQRVFKKKIFEEETLFLAYHTYLKPRFESLMELEDASLWPEVRENEAPTFHAWLSVPDVTSCLLSIGIPPCDTAIINSLKWIEKHIIEENGITGLEIGAPQKGRVVNWSTGHGLIAIGKWEKAITKSIVSQELIQYILDDEQSIQNIASMQFAKKIRQYSQKANYYKNLSILSSSISILLGILVFTNYGLRNFQAINNQWQFLIDQVNKIASNELLNFAMGFLGFLPLVYAAFRNVRKRFISNKEKE